MGSKMLTRVPSDKTASASSSEKKFSLCEQLLSLKFSFTISVAESVSSMYCCKKKNTKSKQFSGYLYNSFFTCIWTSLTFIDIIMITRGEIKVFCCFFS